MHYLLFAVEETTRFLPQEFWGGVVATLVYGPIGIVLLLFGYILFDLITPRINFQKELSEKNVAVGIVIAALLLGVAYIVGLAVR